MYVYQRLPRKWGSFLIKLSGVHLQGLTSPLNFADSRFLSQKHRKPKPHPKKNTPVAKSLRSDWSSDEILMSRWFARCVQLWRAGSEPPAPTGVHEEWSYRDETTCTQRFVGGFRNTEIWRRSDPSESIGKTTRGSVQFFLAKRLAQHLAKFP